jgi:hypothetical protein
MSLYCVIISVLEEIVGSIWCYTEVISKANALVSAATKFSFMFTMAMLESVSAIMLSVSNPLQAKDLDLVECCRHIKLCSNTLLQSKQNNFETIFQKAYELAQELNVAPVVPMSIHRNSINDNESIKVFYRESLFEPYFASLIEELDQRFLRHQEASFKIGRLLPANSESLNINEFVNAVTVYEGFHGGRRALECELVLWKQKWLGMSEKPSTVASTLASCNAKFFPCIQRLLTIFQTLPVTTASAERSFSCLKRLKTYLQSSTGKERLNGLAHMTLNHDIQVNADQVFD